ncbi:porin [Xanthobacter autotrophicus]|uniref:porin n=1 Tax=Xanthobacter TaxID=279 RepID=UPI0024AC5FF1|nr:porin [Xanthobacter autotrophicus]MDI4664221.1 porin [Xanthobacter autotrophicus]
MSTGSSAPKGVFGFACLATLLLPWTSVAADLPLKAQPAEHVKVCAAYGPGFYYIPGTDTCLRVGGWARMDTYLNVAAIFSQGSAFSGPGYSPFAFPFRDKHDADYFTQGRGVAEIDARTQTDYGTLRSYFRGGMEWDSQTGPAAGPGAALYVERAFIQFGGLTFGYTQSFFDTGIGYSIATLFAGSNTWNTTAAYTAEFGNGLSASLALEDAANRTTGVQATGVRITGVSSPSDFPFVTGGTGAPLLYANYQGGQQAPDVVANLRAEGAWGLVQLAGALHEVMAVTPSYLGAAIPGIVDTGQWGYALGAYAEIRLPFIAAGDSLYLQANYSDGALNYAGLAAGNQNRLQAIGYIQLNGAGLMNGAYYPLADAVMGSSGSYEMVGAWAVQAQFRHFWTPGLRSAVFGGYVSVDVPDNIVGAESFAMWQAGVNTFWSPVRNLDIGVEAVYTAVDGRQPLGIVNAVAANGSAIPTLVGGSADALSGAVRLQRNF